MTQTIKVLGMDPSFRNWGVVSAQFDITTRTLSEFKTQLIQTHPDKSKQVRQNSADIQSAKSLYQGVLQACRGAQAIFVEVPSGSRSARGMAGYGVCSALLGVLKAQFLPIYEFTQQELKLMATGSLMGTKEQTIAWAMQHYPEVSLPTLATQRDHVADALAALHVGLTSEAFGQVLTVLEAQGAPTPSGVDALLAHPQP